MKLVITVDAQQTPEGLAAQTHIKLDDAPGTDHACMVNKLAAAALQSLSLHAGMPLEVGLAHFIKHWCEIAAFSVDHVTGPTAESVSDQVEALGLPKGTSTH